MSDFRFLTIIGTIWVVGSLSEKNKPFACFLGFSILLIAWVCK